MTSQKKLFTDLGFITVAIIILCSINSINAQDNKVYEVRPDVTRTTVGSYKTDNQRLMDAYERLMDRYLSMVEANISTLASDTKQVNTKLDIINAKIEKLEKQLTSIEQAITQKDQAESVQIPTLK